jgi:hypothetical protein
MPSLDQFGVNNAVSLKSGALWGKVLPSTSRGEFEFLHVLDEYFPAPLRAVEKQHA